MWFSYLVRARVLRYGLSMNLSKCLLSILCLGFFSLSAAPQKKVLILTGQSTHNNYSHNNDEVGKLIQFKLEQSKYASQFDIKYSFKYPADLSLVEQADLIIISSDGGKGHALANNGDLTKHSAHLDAVLKKTKAGLIVIHWATDSPSNKVFGPQPENDAFMQRWIGACYYWGGNQAHPVKSWTWKFPVLELAANKAHPIANGVPELFKLQDEYYFNFFTQGAGSRNPVSDRITPIHSGRAPQTHGDIKHNDRWTQQPCYWAFQRDDSGRSVAMTSAHMYHTWANKHFFQTFMNSVFWAAGLDVPANGVEISTPTIKELKSMGGNVGVSPKALYFEKLMKVLPEME